VNEATAPGHGEVDVLHLVRHAKAGDRERWTEDDRLRPLSKKGRRQAEGLVQLFQRVEVTRIVSSPYLRCVQTVRPLSLARGLTVEPSDALAEGAATVDALALLDATPSGGVLCSHGDVIPAVIDHLRAGGMLIDGEPGWKKGSVWILQRRTERYTRARYAPPPRFD
jgi:phosphohistidine phosphatase SixA